MSPRFAYVSQGKLYLKSGDSPEELYESPFVRGIRDRAFELQRRHSWKMGSPEDDRLIPRASLWGAGSTRSTLDRIDFNAVCAQGGAPGIVYSIRSPQISGVLALQQESGAEFRLLHTADFRVSQLASQRGTGRITLSVQHAGGSTVAVMDANGGALVEVTQGESSDESPSWAGVGSNTIVYQSAGLAFNEQGALVGTAPYRIQTIDLDTSRITTLLESPEHDLLTPRLSDDGTLHFIRRPYKVNRNSFNPLRFVEDLLFLPFRLIYAFFQFLNFFTIRYTGKPLSQSGPTLQKEADQRRMILWGNVVEAQRSLLGRNSDGPSLVPGSWELCSKAPDGNIKVLAKSVLSFDLVESGGYLYTDGASVFYLAPDGQKVRVHKGSLIQQVAALPSKTSEGANAVASSEPATVPCR